ncbi:hypothetical protein [Zooshikella ganghwensis]|nr:hypothetical protein [Zooshikella ganghwensis]
MIDIEMLVKFAKEQVLLFSNDGEVYVDHEGEFKLYTTSCSHPLDQKMVFSLISFDEYLSERDCDDEFELEEQIRNYIGTQKL